jgi:carbon monoxide dehydrogenase subunit G
MAAIEHSVEIARSPEDVFAYIDDLERHGEWQPDIVSSTRETDGPTRVGTRATDVRRVPGGKQSVTYEITEHEPPRMAAFKGVNGPVRPVGTVTVEAAGEGRSKVTVELDLQGHGLLGAVFAPLARREVRKSLPESHRLLKERLESKPNPT